MHDPSQLAPEPVREGVGTSGAERNWPLNSWWVAAHGSEVSDKPLLRWIAEMPISLYRTEAGQIAALHNRCPHRWAPLHMGEVRGDNLICPYHGMQFAPSGQCTKVPTQNKTPSAIRVRSFPAVERYGFIWLWTGDAAHANPAEIPEDLRFLDARNWHSVWGYFSVQANYMQIKENVLDLTHFAFLHKKSLAIPGWERAPQVETTAERVTYRQVFEMDPLPPIYAVPAGKNPGTPVNRVNWGTQLTPGINMGAIDMNDPAPGPGEVESFHMRVLHLTSPVSIAKTHYYWVLARDHGEPFDVEATRAQTHAIFGEDIEMVEAIQAMAQRAIDQDGAIEYSVNADQAAIEGRRRVQKLIKAEQA